MMNAESLRAITGAGRLLGCHHEVREVVDTGDEEYR